MADGRVEYEIRADDSQLDEDLKKGQEKAEKGSGKFKEIAGKSAKAIGAGFIAAGGAAIGVGVAAVKSANDMDKAMNDFIMSTGKGTEEAERYQGILEDIYVSGYGESFEDIANSMGLVNQQMGDMSDEELQKTVESAYLLADTFDIDINEGIRGANSMMKQFGIDSETAYNLMAQGAQNGLNQNQDLADQVAEYSVYFADMGFSAEEMFNIMANGAEDGAFQIDYLNDAVKEFGIRTKEESKTTQEAFGALGLDADDLTSRFAKGGEDAKSAFSEVVKALSGVEDEVVKNQIGVDLFGTKFEDLGIDAVLAMTDTQGSINGTTDALGEMEEVKFDNLGEMFDGLKRAVEMLLLPLGEMLIPVLKDLIENIMPILQELIPPIIELTGEFIESLLPVVEELLPVLIELFKDMLPPLIEMIETILPVLVELFVELAPPIMEIIEKLLPPLLSLVDALLPILLDLIDLLMPIIGLFIELLDPIIDLINSAILPLIEAIMPLINILAKVLTPILKIVMSVFEEVFKGIAGYVTDQIGVITNVLSNVIDFIKNVFTGNWSGAWENLVNIFRSIVSGIGNIFKAPLNVMIDGINGFIRGLNKIKIPDWVPVVGGRGFRIGTIPRLKVGMDYVPSDDFPALLHEGEAVLTAEEAKLYRSLGGDLQSLLNTPGKGNSYATSITQSISKTDMKWAMKEAIRESSFGDTVLQVGYEELARASNKGNEIIDIRYKK